MEYSETNETRQEKILTSAQELLADRHYWGSQEERERQARFDAERELDGQTVVHEENINAAVWAEMSAAAIGHNKKDARRARFSPRLSRALYRVELHSRFVSPRARSRAPRRVARRSVARSSAKLGDSDSSDSTGEPHRPHVTHLSHN